MKKTLTGPPVLDLPAGSVTGTPTAKVGTPYIQFAHPKQKVYPAMVLASAGSVKEGDPYLVQGDAVTAIPNPRFFLVSAYKYFAVRDQSGTVVFASREESGAERESENWQCLVLVFVDGTLVPAIVNAKSGYARGIAAAVKELEAAGKPEWAAQSPAHQAAMMQPMPWARFTVSLEVSKNPNRAKGTVYYGTKATFRPSDPEDWTALGKLFLENRAAYDKAAESQRRRVDDVELVMN